MFKSDPTLFGVTLKRLVGLNPNLHKRPSSSSLSLTACRSNKRTDAYLSAHQIGIKITLTNTQENVHKVGVQLNQIKAPSILQHLLVDVCLYLTFDGTRLYGS